MTARDDVDPEVDEQRRNPDPYRPHRCPTGRPCRDCLDDVGPDEW